MTKRTMFGIKEVMELISSTQGIPINRVIINKNMFNKNAGLSYVFYVDEDVELVKNTKKK
jgi:hypothetical protein